MKHLLFSVMILNLVACASATKPIERDIAIEPQFKEANIDMISSEKCTQDASSYAAYLTTALKENLETCTNKLSISEIQYGAGWTDGYLQGFKAGNNSLPGTPAEVPTYVSGH